MRKLGILLGFGFLLTSATFSQTVLTSKPNQTGIKSPFKTDFSLSFQSNNNALAKVAQLLDSGRRHKSVETLLSAALILFLEEKCSGAKASITGLSVLQEATNLALKSKNKNILKLVASFWDDPAYGNNQKFAYELVYEE
ncbi:hypothetical protein MASR1M107_11880 [Ignavibacteriales bacterium]